MTSDFRLYTLDILEISKTMIASHFLRQIDRSALVKTLASSSFMFRPRYFSDSPIGDNLMNSKDQPIHSAPVAWNWVPPRNQGDQRVDDDIIPVLPRKLLTLTEIETALSKQGAENIVSIKLMEPIDGMTDMIIATATSSRHIKKMSDSIVRAVSSSCFISSLDFKPSFAVEIEKLEIRSRIHWRRGRETRRLARY